MIRIKFKDNIIKEYSIDILKRIPFFKGLIESCNKIDDNVPFNDFNSGVIDHLIHNYKNINFDKYDFDELFYAKEFLMLYNKPQIQTQFTNQLKNLLLNDIDKINLDNLQNYIRCEDEYMMSDIVNKNPILLQLYPHVTSLRYANPNINLTRFNNLVKLIIPPEIEINTLTQFGNLKNLKELYCSGCFNLEDGCFDIFTNLDLLCCNDCDKLKRPFNNLKNLKILFCRSCHNLEDGCFDTLTNLKKLDCTSCTELRYPFRSNLKYLNVLNCSDCINLRDGCFDVFVSLEKLMCSFCNRLENPFNKNLKNLKILCCQNCDNLKNRCFSKLTNLEKLNCKNCYRLKKPFDNLINLKKLNCSGCSKLKDCFDALINLKNLHCKKCFELRKPFDNLKNLKKLVYMENGEFKPNLFDNLDLNFIDILY